MIEEVQGPGFHRTESPHLRSPGHMSLDYIGKVGEQETRCPNRVVTHAATRDYREPCRLDCPQHFGPEDHVVVARDKAVDPPASKLDD